MNKTQRRQLSVLEQRFEWLTTPDGIVTHIPTASELLQEDIAAFQSELETVLDGEESKYDNMPESLQGAEQGEAMQEAIDHLQNAISALQDAIDFEFERDDAMSAEEIEEIARFCADAMDEVLLVISPNA